MGRLDEEQTEGKLLLFTADLLTVLLLTIGCAVSFASGYGLQVDLGAVAVFCAFAGTAATVLHRLNQPWGALAAAGGIAAAFWLAWEDAAPVLEWMAQKMNLRRVLTGLPLSAWPGGGRLLPVFLLLCAALAWLLGWIAVRARRWYLAALLTFILVLPAIQNGVLPAWGAMLAVFAGWGSMLLTSLYGRKDPGGLGRAKLLALGGMAALILLLAAALPMEGYTRPQWATDARTDLIQGVSDGLGRFMDRDALDNGILADLGLDLSLPGQGGSGSGTGGAGTGLGGPGIQEDLLHAGPRRYSGQRVLTVVSEEKAAGRIYLRGNSLGVYTGTSWEMVDGGYPFFSGEADIPPMSQPSLFPAEASDGDSYTMRIRDVSRRGVLYYPYHLASGGWWLTESGQLTLAGTGGRDPEYEVAYVPGSPEDAYRPLAGSWAQEERVYREQVVRHNYLEVPDRAWEALLSIVDGAAAPEYFDEPLELREDMGFRERFEVTVAAASRTARLLDAIADYDVNTPAMGGEYGDFMEFFLAEKRGYCIHFATAGALLLRMQGIPARYVTGYTVGLNSSGEGTALDSDAHAWVEVYITGYGWYPVEMTPGYAGGGDGVSLTGAAGDEEPGEADTPEEEGPEEEPDTPEDPPEEDPVEDEPSGEGAVEDVPGFVFPWKAVLGGLLALGALAGAYKLSFLPRELAKGNGDVNRSVICAYLRYSRGLRWGGGEDETLEELGRKAKFSQHTLTAEEREAAWRALDAAAERIRGKLPKCLKLLFPLMRPFL